jgi:carboxymethylenebutenolidase
MTGETMATIELTAADGHTFAAYETKPEGEPRAGLVVVQEIFGVNSHIRDVADAFAAEGYHVISPALFDRAERGVEIGYEKADAEKGVALRAAIPLEQALHDIHAAVEALESAGKVGLVGYCWGGSLAWLSAARVPSLSATVGYYGSMIAAHVGEVPRCPVMLHFGEKDTGIPMSDVEKVRAGTDPEVVQIFTYPAGHAFNREGFPPHEPHSAMLAQMRTLRFFAEHLDG